MDMDIFQLVTALDACHGPAGDEGEIRTAIERFAAPYADEIRTDALGNLIVHKKGPGPKLLFSAHMDSIGFIVTHFEKEGFLRVGRLGGVDPKEVLYTPVRFKNGVRGVVVKEEKTEFGKVKIDDLLIDIGAKDEDEARAAVQLGDTAVVDLEPARLLGSKVSGPYMDDRICCAMLLAALAQLKSHDNDLYFLFSVQEEVGLRGARTAAYSIAPDYGVAVDVTAADDAPGSDRSGTAVFGKGAAVKVMDSSVICHPAMVTKLEELGLAQGIPTQRDILRGGGTDAGAIHTTCNGVITGGISVPCRYIHTPVEMVDLEDVTACVRLIVALAQSRMNEG